MLASVLGNNLGTDKTAVTVTVGGKSGFVLVATGTQLNVQIPVELTPGPTTITITRSGAQQGETARHQIDRIQNQLRRMDETWTGGDAVWITVSDLVIYDRPLGIDYPANYSYPLVQNPLVELSRRRFDFEMI